jgi:hypothetical protein
VEAAGTTGTRTGITSPTDRRRSRGIHRIPDHDQARVLSRIRTHSRGRIAEVTMKPAPIPDIDWQWRWVYTLGGDLLHRVAGTFSPPDSESEEFYTGVPIVTVCGRYSRASMPGVMSRLGRPRCKHCCKGAGVPQGVGNPFNEGLRE